MAEKHFVDSLVLLPALVGCRTLLDLGSGAGLPGMALACARRRPRGDLLRLDRQEGRVREGGGGGPGRQRAWRAGARRGDAGGGGAAAGRGGGEPGPHGAGALGGAREQVPRCPAGSCSGCWGRAWTGSSSSRLGRSTASRCSASTSSSCRSPAPPGPWSGGGGRGCSTWNVGWAGRGPSVYRKASERPGLRCRPRPGRGSPFRGRSAPRGPDPPVPRLRSRRLGRHSVRSTGSERAGPAGSTKSGRYHAPPTLAFRLTSCDRFRTKRCSSAHRMARALLRRTLPACAGQPRRCAARRAASPPALLPPRVARLGDGIERLATGMGHPKGAGAARRTGWPGHLRLLPCSGRSLGKNPGQPWPGSAFAPQ